MTTSVQERSSVVDPLQTERARRTLRSCLDGNLRSSEAREQVADAIRELTLVWLDCSGSEGSRGRARGLIETFDGPVSLAAAAAVDSLLHGLLDSVDQVPGDVVEAWERAHQRTILGIE